jgi:hypothetical protein
VNVTIFSVDATTCNMIPLRRLTLAAIALSVVLIAIRVSSYRQLFAMPGSVPFIAKPLIVLAVYFAVVMWMTSDTGGDRAVALSVGTSFGVVTATVQVLHLFIESFVPTEELVTGITALVFMIGTFLLWAVAGYVTGRRGAPVSAAATAGSWAAIVCMLILVAVGLVLTFVPVPSASYVSTWSEFRESGWTDATAFGIANTFDSAYSHLLAGPIVGAITGAIGGLIGKHHPNRHTPISSVISPDK